MGQTLYDKIYNSHLVDKDLLYIDRQLIHEVTSPQAFEGLRSNNRKVKNPNSHLAVPDHNVPTEGDRDGINSIKDNVSRIQVETLKNNCEEFGIKHFDFDKKEQGIVHVVGPEQGFTQPGMTIVCGDSHTSTHGAFGALAFGIGTSEVEHVLSTQTLQQKKAKNMLIKITGNLKKGVVSKDVILAIISHIGTSGGTGYVIEYTGDVVRNLSMEGRMTLCNMSIEAGARAGLVSPDNKTFEYLQGRKFAPKKDEFDKAVEYWKRFRSDKDAKYDKEILIDGSQIEPYITWGTSPEDALPINESVPSPEDFKNKAKKQAVERSLKYMGLLPKTPFKDIYVDKVFIGSCTNGRIEDLRLVAEIVKGKKVAHNIKLAMVVPGSGLVKEQAEKEGLDKIFINAGMEWRQAGCSMCLAMNNDKLKNQERCASTSNRNFEGRQGRGGRTHLVSPVVAAFTAINGYLSFQEQELNTKTHVLDVKGISNKIKNILKIIKDKLVKKPNNVAVVNLDGIIGKANRIDQAINIDNVNYLLEKAFKVKNLKAVAINVNSPGGSPVQSELIYLRIKELSEEKNIPVFTFAQDVAASGGYFILLSGEEIYAHKASVIGSIGVISAGFGFEEAIKKIGVNRRVYSQGKNKAVLDPFLPEKKENIEILLNAQKDIYESFKEIVRENRKDKLSKSEDELFTGAFWSGKEAMNLGLVDGIDNMRNVIKKKIGRNTNFITIKERKKGMLKNLISHQTSFFVDMIFYKIKNEYLFNKFDLK